MVTIFMLLHVFNTTSLSEILFPRSLVAKKGRRNAKLEVKELTIRNSFIFIEKLLCILNILNTQ